MIEVEFTLDRSQLIWWLVQKLPNFLQAQEKGLNFIFQAPPEIDGIVELDEGRLRGMMNHWATQSNSPKGLSSSLSIMRT